MSVALTDFVQSPENNIIRIEQKFGEPGHGNIQEVDSAHSIIENYLSPIDIWSPLDVITQLRKLQQCSSRNYKFDIIPMLNINEILDYASVASSMTYSNVPYTQVKHLLYTQKDISAVRYKKSFEDSFTTAAISNGIDPHNSLFPKIYKGVSDVLGLIAAKRKDINKMIKFMSNINDVNFYKGLTKDKIVKVKKTLKTKKAVKVIKSGKVVKKRLIKSKKHFKETMIAKKDKVTKKETMISDEVKYQ